MGSFRNQLRQVLRRLGRSPRLPRLNEIGLDGNVILFTLALSLFASLLFGCIPILKYAGRRFGTGLRDGGRSMSRSRERHRARSALVTVQVALASGWLPPSP